MTKNNAKTVLFTSLIVAMILPFSSMVFASASQSNGDVEIKAMEKSAEKSSDFAKTLLKSSDYKMLDNENKKAYLDFLTKFLSSEDIYVQDALVLIEELSTVSLNLETEQSKEKIKQDKNRHTDIIEELEELGIVDGNKLAANPEYWLEKSRDARDRKGANDITQIHTDDLSLRNEATAYVPIITNGVGGTIAFPITQITWGPSTSWVQGIALTSGNAASNVFACLQNTVEHTTVEFYTSGHAKILSISGTLFWSETYPYSQKSVSGSSTTCTGEVENVYLDFSNRLEVGHVISNPISITGTHA